MNSTLYIQLFSRQLFLQAARVTQFSFIPFFLGRLQWASSSPRKVEPIEPLGEKKWLI